MLEEDGPYTILDLGIDDFRSLGRGLADRVTLASGKENTHLWAERMDI